jgi:hypothetical protein
MNFPQVHGARIRPLPDPELAEAEARLAALDDDELVAARPEWIEETVAKVAGRAPEVRGGRLRRAAAAAVAFFALHGFATAATVTAVSAVAVTAVVLWPEGRNSKQTMSYSVALQLLARSDQDEEHRALAEIKVMGRVRAVVEALQAIRRAPEAPASLVTASEDALDRLRLSFGRAVVLPNVEIEDPVPAGISAIRSSDLDEETRIAFVERCSNAACLGLSALVGMSEPNSRLARDRDIYLQRLRSLLGS